MGRSQVAFNQKYGRPGQKGVEGRGRGGIHGSKQQQIKHLESNGFRYQEEGKEKESGNNITREEFLDQQLLALEAHGNYSHQVTPNEEDMNSDLEIDLDVMKLKLASVSLSEMLDLPLYITESLEYQSRKPILPSPEHKAPSSTVPVESELSTESIVTITPNDHKTGSDDDELEDWLDDMIT